MSLTSLRSFLTRRIAERSTWVGLTALGSLFGLPTEHLSTIVEACLTIAASALVILPTSGGMKDHQA